MRLILFTSVLLFHAALLNAQLVNGSFENGSNPDLTGWEWTCGAQPDSNAPAGGGNYCIKVQGGNPQGCFPGYAFQKLPAVTGGQSFILSGWVRGQAAPYVGIYFGKINNGIISLQQGDTTTATVWTQLNVQASFSLSNGDTAVIVLFAGFTGGPVQPYGYFDLINLQEVAGIDSPEQHNHVSIFPNPFNRQAFLQSDISFNNATLILYDCIGRLVLQINEISGNEITIQRDKLPAGLYIIRVEQDNKIKAIIKTQINNY